MLDSSGGEPLAYRVFIDARSGKVLARDSLVDNAAAAAAVADVQLQRRGAGDERRLRRREGSVHRRGRRRRARDRHVRQRRHALDNDIVLNLYRGDDAGRPADTVTSPERIRYATDRRRAGRRLLRRRSATSWAKAPRGPPAHLHGHAALDNTAPPTPYLARWDLFPANPPLSALDADPWNTPSTDTRQKWCWKSSPNAADCNRVIGNLASRTPVGRRRQDRHGDEHDDRQQRAHGRVLADRRTARAEPVPTRRARRATTRSRGPTSGPRATATSANPVVGQSVDVSAAVTNLFTMHNRMHDWSYLLGFTEDNWNAQSSNFGLTAAFRRERPGLGDAQAGALAGAPSDPATTRT